MLTLQDFVLKSQIKQLFKDFLLKSKSFPEIRMEVKEEFRRNPCTLHSYQEGKKKLRELDFILRNASL